MHDMGSGGHVGSNRRCRSGLAWPTALVLVAIASIAGATSASAQAARADDETSGQPRPWRLGVWVQSGTMKAFGRFATQPLSRGSVIGLDVRAELESAMVHSVGLEVRFPTQGLSLRTGWETTTDGAAEGSLAICDLVGCLPMSVSATVGGPVIEARVFESDPERRVAPLFALAYGRRWYSFGDLDCTDLTDDPRIICDAIAEVFESPGSHSVFRVSAGVGAYLGRFRADLAASATGGDYSGGEGETVGLWYPDLRLTLGVGLVVF